MYNCFFKRVFDLMLAIFALLCIAWLIIIIAIWLHFANKGAGAFFFQPRPGKDGKIFNVIKFKTMTDEKDDNGNLLPDAQRLTGVGKFVRATSLDELPQFINMLKGDMSLIGPRPLLVKYLPYYTEEESHRHDVRPGITGWAQIHGRNSIKSWEQRFAYDLEYVNNISFWFDIKIIFMTIKNVIKSDGVVEPGFQDDFDVYRMKQRGENKDA